MLKYAIATIDLQDLDTLREAAKEAEYLKVQYEKFKTLQENIADCFKCEYCKTETEELLLPYQELITVDVEKLIAATKKYALYNDPFSGFDIENAIIAKLQ